MRTQPLGRRQILQGAGAAASGVAIATLGLTSSVKADDNDDHRALLGAWMITRLDDGDTATTTGVASFVAGGVAFYQDINPVGPAFVGAFAQSNQNRFRSTIISGSRADEPFPGVPALTQVVQTTGRRDKDAVSGTYTATATDAATGEVLGTPLTGTFTGIRIEP